MKFGLKLCSVLIGALCTLTIFTQVQAQSNLAKVDLIPSSAIAAIYLNPKAIVEDPAMDLRRAAALILPAASTFWRDGDVVFP